MKLKLLVDFAGPKSMPKDSEHEFKPATAMTLCDRGWGEPVDDDGRKELQRLRDEATKAAKRAHKAEAAARADDAEKAVEPPSESRGGLRTDSGPPARRA